ncbi:Unknown protein, partial [Striga hermonthica]
YYHLCIYESLESSMCTNDRSLHHQHSNWRSANSQEMMTNTFQSFVLRSCLISRNTFFQKSVHSQSAVSYNSLNCELMYLQFRSSFLFSIKLLDSQ